MKAVVMAGGEGTRLRPLTQNRPKPLVPVLNKPIAQHIIEHCKRAGITDIVVTLYYLAEEIQNYFGDGSDLGVNLIYSIEDTPLGTAGSVKKAQQYLEDDTFIIVSGDALTDLNIEKSVQIVDQKSNTIGLANGSAITGATIHATVVAFDTFDATNILTRGYTGNTINQNVTILGGYICKNNGNFGTIFANGNLRSGFTRTLRYDARVAYNPPPSFPTTANRYILSSLQRVTATLE